MPPRKSLRWTNLPVTPTRSGFYTHPPRQTLCFEDFAQIWGGRGGSTARLLLALVLLVTTPPAFAAQRPAASPEAQTARYFESVRKDPNLLVAFLLEMPKGGDLHNHLWGAIYAESFINWAAAGGLCVEPATFTLTAPPCAAPKVEAKEAFGNLVLYRSMVDAYSMRNWQLSGQSAHDHFFDTFDKFDAAARGNTGAMLAETANRAATQRELYQELMITPTGAAFSAMMNSEAVKAIKLPDNAHPDTLATMRQTFIENGLPAALKEARQQTDEAELQRDALLGCSATSKAGNGCHVTQRYLFQVLRSLPKEIVYAQMVLGFELAKADPRFVGLNMVMPEDYYVPLHDFRLHMAMMHYLRSQYPEVHISLHAGELAAGLVPPEDLRFHIRASVDTAGADRIGHGVTVMNETRPYELLDEMASRKIMVEICLTSNDTVLGVSGRNHPLHDYMRAGVPVVLATDDEGVSRSDMTHEFLRGVEDQNLTYGDLKRMARTSLQYAFIPGPGLWADATAFKPVADCAAAKIGETATAACQAFLDKSEKARLQWLLEWQFREFENRKWAAGTN
jgi:adenosine deaminase